MSETFRVGDEPTSTDLFAPPTEEEKGDGMVSALEGLRAALSAPVESPPITIRVPGRPGVTIRCHTRMSQEERKAWQARSKAKKRRGAGADEVDEMLFAQLVIANTCEAIAFNGTDAHDEEGTPLNFRHRQVWDMVGASDAPTAIRLLFGVDAHVLLASGEVLLASGFDDELNDGEGPTRAS